MKRVNRSSWISCVLIGVCGAAQMSQAGQHALDEADAAYARLDQGSARRILEKLLEDPSASAEDRVRAQQKLAGQDWKFRRDPTAARERLARADGAGIRQGDTWLILSGVERGAGQYSAAAEAAQRAVKYAESRSQEKDAWVAFAKAVLEEAITSQEATGSYHRRSLSEASTHLRELLAEEPGHRDASNLLIGVALLLDDGPTALEAWRSYYHVPPGQSARGLLEAPCQALTRILSGWVSRDLTPGEQEQVVSALAGSRLFRYAALVGRKTRPGESSRLTDLPKVAEVVAYSDFLANARELTNEFYRLTALGKEDRAAYRKGWDLEASRLWERLRFEGERPALNSQAFEEELSRRFGAYISFGMAGGYYGLGYGHRVIDEPRQVEQYGREAKIRLVVLDSMVSYFYSSWAGAGTGGAGGWAKAATIYQVREAYGDTPFRAWRAATDPVMRRELEEVAARMIPSDDAIAAEHPYSFLPGLQIRLYLKCSDRVFTSVKEQGYQGAQACLAFVAEFDRLVQGCSIFAHEGRHAIDEVLHPADPDNSRPEQGTYRSWSQEKKEFRAKLSELAFAADPQLAFANAILDESIGDQTAHGQANERVVKGIIEWMGAHRSEIASLDESRPMLPQFDLLTFEQIRSAVREMDPLWQERRSAAPVTSP